MGEQTTVTLSPGNIPKEIAVDSKERVGGLKVAPKINISKATVGLDGIAKARAIIQAIIAQAKSVKDWLMKSDTGFNLVRDIDQAVRDEGPEFLDIMINMEEQCPEGTFTVSRTTREVRDIFKVKINAYLNWGELFFVEGIQYLHRLCFSPIKVGVDLHLKDVSDFPGCP